MTLERYAIEFLRWHLRRGMSAPCIEVKCHSLSYGFDFYVYIENGGGVPLAVTIVVDGPAAELIGRLFGVMAVRMHNMNAAETNHKLAAIEPY